MGETVKIGRKRGLKIAAGVLVGLFCLGLIEIGVRVYFAQNGYKTGSLLPSWEKSISLDSLHIEKDYFTDSLGIFKAIPGKWNTEGDRVLINRDGFRGPDFVRDSATNTHLLLIGDSYTWGSHASPFDSSFADIISRQQGWTSFNTGIPGADPVQYELIARKFVPQLKPEVTVVIFFMANDLMSERRPPAPGKDLYFKTNHGWFPGFYKGHYFDNLQEAIAFRQGQYQIKNAFTKLIAKSAFGTFLLSLPLRLEEYSDWNIKKEGAIANEYLAKIAATCSQNSSKLVVFVIPSPYADLEEMRGASQGNEAMKLYFFQKYPHLFTGLEENTFILPLESRHYLPLPDGHFNNAGHRVAGKYMVSVVDSLLQSTSHD